MAPIPEREQEDPNKNQPEQDDIAAIETPQFNIAMHSSSDSDGDEGVDLGGYQMLPQEPGSDSSESDSDVEAQPESDGVIVSESLTVPPAEPSSALAAAENLEFAAFMHAGQPYMKVPENIPGDHVERTELWNQPCQQSDRLPLDEDQTEKIKAAMSGFSLPKPNIPSWASGVSEEDWRTQLFMKLQGKSSEPKPDAEKKPKNKDCDKTDESRR